MDQLQEREERQKRKNQFKQLVDGHEPATTELEDYLKKRGAKAAAGDKNARDELETLAYEITKDYVTARLRRDFHFLVARHSVASIIHEAWLKLTDPASDRIADLVSFCRRLRYMIRYVFLDLKKDLLRWYDRHHGAVGEDGADPDVPGFALDEVADGRFLGPDDLAIWSEFQERIAKLPDKERKIFEMSYYFGMSRRGILKMLEKDPTEKDVTEYDVRVRLLKAKKLLGNGL